MTNDQKNWIKTASFLREAVHDADGNWAEVPIDVLLDIAEFLENLTEVNK